LPMPTQPATLTATRVATKATSTFFIGIPLSFTPRDAHFVPRCTVGRPRKPMVHRLRRQWGTSKGTVSLGTQLRGVRSKTCQKAAADRPPGTHHSPSISGLNSSSSALRLDRLLRLRWLTARCPTPSHLALHGRTTSACHSSRWVVQHSGIPRLRSESGLGCAKTKSDLVVIFTLRMTTEPKIPGAVIPRRVFTQPGSTSGITAAQHRGLLFLDKQTIKPAA
jgi:hypothetical protein